MCVNAGLYVCMRWCVPVCTCVRSSYIEMFHTGNKEATPTTQATVAVPDAAITNATTVKGMYIICNMTLCLFYSM